MKTNQQMVFINVYIVTTVLVDVQFQTRYLNIMDIYIC